MNPKQALRSQTERVGYSSISLRSTTPALVRCYVVAPSHAQILVEVVGVVLALGADHVVSRGTDSSTSGDTNASATAAGAEGGGGGAPGHIRRAVTRLGPNFVKIGQALASRPDLVGEAIAGELLLLQDAMPLFSNEVAREFIREVSERLNVPRFFFCGRIEIVSTSTTGW